MLEKNVLQRECIHNVMGTKTVDDLALDLRVVHSRVWLHSLGSRAGVDTWCHGHCHSLPGGGVVFHRWETDLEQRYYRRGCKHDWDRQWTVRDQLLRDDMGH